VRRTAMSLMSNVDLRMYPRVLEALAHWYSTCLDQVIGQVKLISFDHAHCPCFLYNDIMQCIRVDDFVVLTGDSQHFAFA
jgi:hypothetical protein